MTRAIELSDSDYAALENAATAAGLTPGEWIAAQLPRPEPEEVMVCEGQPPRTLADRFEGYLGLVSFEPSDVASRAGELFADGMVEKYREGRL